MDDRVATFAFNVQGRGAREVSSVA